MDSGDFFAPLLLASEAMARCVRENVDDLAARVADGSHSGPLRVQHAELVVRWSIQAAHCQLNLAKEYGMPKRSADVMERNLRILNMASAELESLVLQIMDAEDDEEEPAGPDSAAQEGK